MNKYKCYPRYRSSGIPWFGDVPEHWEVKRAKTLFTEIVEKGIVEEPLLSVTQDKGLVDRKEQEEEGVRVWNPGEDVSGYKLVRRGEFVISLRSFEGGIEFSELQGLVSPAYTVMRPHKEALNRYYKSLLKCSPFVAALQANSKGIRQGKNIQFEDFGALELLAHSTSKCTTLPNDFKRCAEAEAFARPLVKQNLQTFYLS